MSNRELIDNIAQYIMWAVIIGIIIMGPSSCMMHRVTIKAEIIAKGINPIDASCAFDISPNIQECMIRATINDRQKTEVPTAKID